MKVASLFQPSYAEGERLAGEAGVMLVGSVTWGLFKMQGKRGRGSWRGLDCLHTGPHGRPGAGVRQGSSTWEWHLWESDFYEDCSLLPFNHLNDGCLWWPQLRAYIKKHQNWGLGSLWCFSGADGLWKAQKWFSFLAHLKVRGIRVVLLSFVVIKISFSILQPDISLPPC